MTQKEAMAQALGTVFDYTAINGIIPEWDEAAEAILAALPHGAAIVTEESLTRELDRHWLLRMQNGSAGCTCGGWQFDLDDRLIEVGEHLAPFNQHVAAAIIEVVRRRAPA